MLNPENFHEIRINIQQNEEESMEKTKEDKTKVFRDFVIDVGQAIENIGNNEDVALKTVEEIQEEFYKSWERRDLSMPNEIKKKGKGQSRGMT
ncbi:MAG: hypothetical protein SO016_01350 [Lachnospiraceae bacterium]|nr:hypothetical protein [Lachnospiraceae bacterium]